MSQSDDKMLDALFTGARTREAEVDAALLARVLSDAKALQPAPEPVMQRMPQARLSQWRQILEQIGGWPAVAGLAAATVAGVWIGTNPPSALDSGVLALLGATDVSEAFSASSDFDFTQFEG